MTMKKQLLAAGALAILGFATGVQAAPSPASTPDSNGVKVSFAGLDLAREDGARIALQRIRQAARRVCGGAPDIRDLEQAHPYVACLDTTVDHAVAMLGSPMVTALNAPRGRQATVLAANRR